VQDNMFPHATSTVPGISRVAVYEPTHPSLHQSPTSIEFVDHAWVSEHPEYAGTNANHLPSRAIATSSDRRSSLDSSTTSTCSAS
jgi:hypothetical protein